MRGNTIQIELPLKRGKVSKTIPLYQYDYGQNLVITGAELPDAYEVHFANEMHGEAVTAIGGSTGVAIPDSVLTSGDPIYLWLYLHEDSTDGETEFQGVIPVIKRASISDQTPTPAEQSAITEAIAALNTAVTQTTAAKNAAVAAQTHIENMTVSGTSTGPETETTVTKSVNAQGEVHLAFSIPRGDKGDKGDQGVQGEPGTSGTNGTDGVSPIVSMSKSGGTTTLSITDSTHTDTVNIYDGYPASNIAPAFSTSSTYAVGDHVTYNEKYYVCSTAVSTAGAWDSSKWTEKTVGGETSALLSDLTQAENEIDALENVLNPVIPIVWTDYGSSSYPTGWRTGWYNSDTGSSAGSEQYMRLYKLVEGIDNYAIKVTPPNGRYAVITEYSDKPAGTANYVNGLMGVENQTISYQTVTGHYYGISIGYWDVSSASDITPEYTAKIHGEFEGSLVAQSFGQSEDLTISQKTVTNNLYNPLNTVINNTKKSGRFLERGVTIESGNEHELDIGQFIRKNWSVAFCGTISSFASMKIGLNYKAGSTAALTDYPRGLIAEITGTKVTVTKRVRVNGDIQYETVLDESHGITIGSYIQCVIRGTDTNAGTIHLECDGVAYDGNISDVEPLYYYCPFVEATNCTISNADISFSCEDFAKDILIIGDSYTRYKNNMWPYYLHEAGFDKNCCINGHGGAKSFSEGYTALDHLLELMHPKFVLWCLGMNDGSDTNENTPNENWVTGRDWMLQSCQSNGCVPVFTTIPNVTDGVDVVLHDGKNKWIRESGHQYIDFALAVGADSTGNWRTGLRENATGFHPSALGAKVLFMQAITDFPQLAIEK